MTNLEYVNWSAATTSSNILNFQSNALNITFPFGTNSFIPSNIQIQNNGMSNTNVDNSVNNLYTNRTKWNTYTVAKVMNISGTNASPTGTYQAPAGFSLGVSDGTPASAKEQIYVLVNNYNWTITYT